MAQPLRISRHAQEKATLRGVTASEIRAIVRNPEVVYESFNFRGTPTPNHYVYQSGKLAVVVCEYPTEDVVVTVLKRTRPGDPRWTDEEVRAR